MKKIIATSFAAFALFALVGLASCKSKPKDSDIQASIEKVIQADADLSKAVVSVKDGIATVSGELKEESLKAKIEEAVKNIAGVKSVVNNCTIVAPPPPAVQTAATELEKAITDALKDYPGVKSELKDGVLKLTGEVAKSSVQKLMIALNGLRSLGLKKIESSGLIKK